MNQILMSDVETERAKTNDNTMFKVLWMSFNFRIDVGRRSRKRSALKNPQNRSKNATIYENIHFSKQNYSEDHVHN